MCDGAKARERDDREPAALLVTARAFAACC